MTLRALAGWLCFSHLDAGLSFLPCLVKLQHLNLASCSKLTDSCLQHITGEQAPFISCLLLSSSLSHYLSARSQVY